MSVKDSANRIRQKINLLLRELEEVRPQELVLACKEQLSLVRLRIQNDATLADGSLLGTYSPAYLKQKTKKRSSDINLTDTGQMWKDTGVDIVFVNETKATVAIVGTTARSEELIGYHSERFGNILEASEDEVKKLKKASIKRVTKTINKYLK